MIQQKRRRIKSIRIQQNKGMRVQNIFIQSSPVSNSQHTHTVEIFVNTSKREQKQDVHSVRTIILIGILGEGQQHGFESGEINIILKETWGEMEDMRRSATTLDTLLEREGDFTPSVSTAALSLAN